MNLNSIHNVYFIGIGGIGMSAIARYFNATGKNVEGYDKVASEITSSLQNEGIKIHFEDELLKKLKFTGSLENETIEQVIEAIGIAANIDYEIEDRDVWLKNMTN